MDRTMVVVPAPVSVEPAAGEFPLGADVVVVAPGEARSVGERLAGWYGWPVRSQAQAGERPVRLELTGSADRHGPEGYESLIRPEEIRVEAAMPAGLGHGVQTLRQLVGSSLAEGRGGSVPAGRIEDRPRFAYRGVMLDVARHFFAVEDVRRLIDLAALLKLNHLHLHLTDDQGWRIAVDSWPRLAEYGGGTQVGEQPGGYYTKADYRSIVDYALRHGITVVPEVDVPGHTNAALASYAELSADGVAPRRYTGIEVGFSALAVGSPVVQRFLHDVFAELAALTPGPYLHFGGDEVKTLDAAAYASFVERVQDVIALHGKIPIGWHEVTAAGLAPSTVVQYWGVNRADEGMARVVAHGNRVILSPADRTYLDMKYDKSTPSGYDWAGYIPTSAAYDWDPASYLAGVDEKAILGIESPLWTETLQTYAEAERLLMPRLAVTAEIAWAETRRGWADLRQRLAAQAPVWTALGVGFHRDPDIPWAD
jgi:hexosaminidase